MAKRSHGEGSINQLPSGKWRGRMAIDGKRLSYVGNTRREVTAWIKKTAEQVEKGLTYDAARVSLGDYLVRWLAGKETSLRPATFQHYKILVEIHLVPALGGYLLKDLAPDHIQHVYDNWNRNDIGVPTIIKAHAVLRQALERARKTGLIYQNVADLVDLPTAPHSEMRFWGESEANHFLMAARTSRLYALFYLAIATGARQMELLGLQWRDLDWTRGTLHIRRQLSRSGEFATLKTRAGTRTIQLGGKSLDVLKEHYERQRLERLLAGDSWKENDLIFTNTIGTPLHHKNLIDRYFKPVVEAAGVPKIRFHDLRHTAVALMLSHGVPVFMVSKIVGHARPSITSDTYGHLMPGAADEVGALMDDLIGPVEVLVTDWTRKNENATTFDRSRTYKAKEPPK